MVIKQFNILVAVVALKLHDTNFAQNYIYTHTQPHIHTHEGMHVKLMKSE